MVSRRLRRTFVLLVFFLSALALPGCTMDFVVWTEVERDGSGTTRLVVRVDAELAELLEEEGAGRDLFSELEGGLGEDWDVQTEVLPDGSKKLTGTSTFPSPERLPLRGDADGVAGLFRDISLEQRTGVFSTETVFSAVLDPSAVLGEVGAERPQEMNPGLVASILGLEHRLRLPGRLAEHNGDTVEDGFVVWRSSLTAPTRMEARSVALNPVPLAALAAATAGLVAIGVFLVLRRKR